MILTLISHVKQRIEGTINSYVRKAALIAAAAVFLLFACAFGLVAGYYALTDLAGFSPLEAAGIVGGGWLALGLLVLAALPLADRAARKETGALAAPAKVARLVDKGASAATRQVGPLPLVMVALAAGFLVARR
ncbi:MAG: hypothetical protein P8Z76_20350 [Alphaproteobacteria bacterium]